MSKAKKLLKEISDNGLLPTVKSWIAEKWFDGNEQVMMGTFYTVVVLGSIILLFVMTNPSDWLINTVQKVFETMGWW